MTDVSQPGRFGAGLRFGDLRPAGVEQTGRSVPDSLDAGGEPPLLPTCRKEA